MDFTPTDSVDMMRESGHQAHLPHIYENIGFLASCNSSHITFMDCTTHTISQPYKANFENDRVSIGINNLCYVIMSYFKKDFVGPCKKVRRVINIFEGPKVHTIYDGTITWDNNDDTGNPYWLAIAN